MTLDPLDMPITKRDLLHYPTKDDLKKELKKFATKDDLKNYPTRKDMENTMEAFRQEMRYEFKCMREDIQKQFSEFTSMMITTIDPLLRELETRQQDREIAAEWHRDHEVRISNLEKQIKPKQN